MCERLNPGSHLQVLRAPRLCEEQGSKMSCFDIHLSAFIANFFIASIKPLDVLVARLQRVVQSVQLEGDDFRQHVPQSLSQVGSDTAREWTKTSSMFQKILEYIGSSKVCVQHYFSPWLLSVEID